MALEQQLTANKKIITFTGKMNPEDSHANMSEKRKEERIKLQQEHKFESIWEQYRRIKERKGQTHRSHIPVTDDGKPTF